MNSRILIQSGKLISKSAWVQTSFGINSRSIYYAAHPYPNDTIKKLMKFLKDNKEQLEYVPPLPKTAGELNEISDKDIFNLTADQEKKLKVIKWEYELTKERFPHSVPEEITSSQWMTLLQTESVTQRKSFLKYLKVKENYRKAEGEKKKKTERIVTPSPEYRSQLFLWLVKNTINAGYCERICESLMNGPHCVVDMGFESVMSNKEVKNTIQQLSMVCNVNKHSNEPFHISFTDLKMDKYCHTQLSHYYPEIYVKTEASFMDLFPSDKLIYLSPNSPNEMKVYDPDAVYIIGGMVDLRSGQQSTLAKAKQLKIRTERFPIDRYILWEKGTKSLTLNQVFSILHTLKDCGDWLQAFRHIPTRKLKKNYRD